MNIIHSFTDWNVQTRDRQFVGPVLCTPSAFYAVERSVRESSRKLWFKKTALTPIGRFAVCVIGVDHHDAEEEMAVIESLHNSIVVDSKDCVFEDGIPSDCMSGYDDWERLVTRKIADKHLLHEIILDYGIVMEVYENDDEDTVAMILSNDAISTSSYWPSISKQTANLIIDDAVRQTASYDEIEEYLDSLVVE